MASTWPHMVHNYEDKHPKTMTCIALRSAAPIPPSQQKSRGGRHISVRAAIKRRLGPNGRLFLLCLSFSHAVPGIVYMKNAISISRKAIALLRATVSIFAVAVAYSQENNTARLKGVVNNLANQPISGALVAIEGFKQSVITNNQGSFEIKYVPGQFIMRISAAGCATNRKLFNLLGPDVVELAPIILVFCQRRIPLERTYRFS
jgi:hypothetical protein